MSTSPASKKRKTIESKEKSTSINSNSQIVEEKSNKSSEKIQIENNKIEEKQETITGEDDSMELFEEYEEEDLTFDHSKYRLRKRTPVSIQGPGSTKDIFVNRSTSFSALLSRAQKQLFEKNEVTIHGLGAAIRTAIHVASELVERSKEKLIMAPTTSTVQLIDDLEPLVEGLPFIQKTRFNSAIHIKIYRK